MAIKRKKTTRVVKRYWPLGVAVFVLLLVALAWIAAPAADWIKALSNNVARLGALGPVIYFVLYVLGTVVLAPSPLMSIAAGVAFGWWGLPLAVISATAGATCSLLLSRYFFGETLEDWLMQRRVSKAAKNAVDEEGWRVLLLLRLSPVVPFGLLNYLLGLTNTPLSTYLLWTAIGILPGSIVDIYIGIVGASAGGTAQFAYMVLGLVATAVIVVLITFKARAYLREAGVKV
jgi:uncharacterized membrane protein YdjX (TVP38/TMEM64 family)